MAELLREALRTVDAVGRYGGEEFLAILPHTPYDEAAQTAERVRQRVAEHVFQVAGSSVRVTVSVGVASYPSDEGRLRPARSSARPTWRLYRAKELGRNRVV